MNTCPSCGYQPLPPDAKYCPNCSRPLDIARQTSVQIDQHISQNAGSVIGVRTETVNGDIYGGDIYQVQVYALSAEGRTGFSQRLLDENASPYKYLAPYGPLDAPLFKGRSREIDDILLDLGTWRLLVLYGPPGVGKTSLLASGVLPRILESGALAVLIRDYAQPLAQTLRAALNASREKLSLDLPETASLAELLACVASQSGGTLVLVFDQFERLFRPPIPPDLAATQVNALIDSLGKVEAQYLRVILSVRDDALVRLGDLQEALPDMFRAFRLVKPLSREEARRAILEPLGEVQKRIYYEDGFVDQVLLPDLDNLTPQNPDTVHPPHLQIVCHRLYRAAVGLENPQVTRQLYRETLKGAQGILHGYLEETLAGLGEGRALAERILIAMATPGAPEWVSSDNLRLNDAGREQVEAALERLADSELLVSRSSPASLEGGKTGIQPQTDGGLLYAFAGQPVRDEVVVLAGDEIGQRLLATRELGRAWAAWAAYRDLATPFQMRRLAAYGGHLTPSPLECLLLIRSAQAANLPAAAWLAALSTEQGCSLVRQLEQLPPEGAPWYFSESELADAHLLLGVEDSPAQPGQTAPNPEEVSYGPLSAASAARQADPARRQAAAIALLAAGRRPALDRLGWALQDSLPPWPRGLRRAELHGAMAEADPPVAALNASRPAGDRLLTWGWRAGRRILAGLNYIFVIVLGASVGAGLGLGLLRFVTALLTAKTPGLFLILNIHYGFFLGGAVALGYLLAGPLLLQPVGPPPASAPDVSSAGAKRLRLVLAVLLGVLLFNLSQAVIVLTTGRLALSGKEAVFGLGLVAGLGWCLALFLPSGGPFWERPRLWPFRMAAIVLVFALLQALFLYRVDYRSSLVFLLTGMDYERNFTGQALISALPGWFNLLALLDAALAAGLLTVGVLLGTRLADRFYQAVIGQPWRRL